ncbi:hypothetical protein CCACVL1_22619 [Corchorus capsularis]|uniref:Uncharacterized protein n=1 Tax=Corchorus capsularis TaxID=210143 RepID=A0A1R3GXT6_COCAP|nr:hypothetical protein CCACVL1_22619 [Corchorus capsularis]
MVAITKRDRVVNSINKFIVSGSNIAAKKATKLVASDWYITEYNGPLAEMHQA